MLLSLFVILIGDLVEGFIFGHNKTDGNLQKCFRYNYSLHSIIESKRHELVLQLEISYLYSFKKIYEC